MELTVSGIIQSGVKKGIKYLLPLFVNCILWGLTCWIPYLNVGTTIGLMVGVMTKMARDEELSMTEIFDPKYRKYMGEFFLVYSFVMMGVAIGLMFIIIPGYVIAIAWMLAIPLVVDKGINPIDAISKSNELTYGKKGAIFGSFLILVIGFEIAILILFKIFSLATPVLGYLIALIGVIFLQISVMGAFATIYGALTKDVK